MNLLSLVGPRLDNIYQIRRNYYYSSVWKNFQSKQDLGWKAGWDIDWARKLKGSFVPTSPSSMRRRRRGGKQTSNKGTKSFRRNRNRIPFGFCFLLQETCFLFARNKLLLLRVNEIGKHVSEFRVQTLASFARFFFTPRISSVARTQREVKRASETGRRYMDHPHL